MSFINQNNAPLTILLFNLLPMDKEYNDFLENEIIARRNENDKLDLFLKDQIEANKMLITQVKVLKNSLQTLKTQVEAYQEVYSK